LPILELVFYEVHVGTFTPEGTFDAIFPRLGDLRDLGVTAVELMPVGQFPGQKAQPHKQLLDLYAELVQVLKRLPALFRGDMSCVEAMASENERALLLRRWTNRQELFACFNFGKSLILLPLSLPQAGWARALNSRDKRWAGPGSALPECLASAPNQSLRIEPMSFALYRSDDRGKT